MRKRCLFLHDWIIIERRSIEGMEYEVRQKLIGHDNFGMMQNVGYPYAYKKVCLKCHLIIDEIEEKTKEITKSFNNYKIRKEKALKILKENEPYL